MSAQPKKKISSVRSKTRRAHYTRKLAGLVTCAHCKQPIPAHIACPECGFYRSNKILTTKTDKNIAKKLRHGKKTETSKKEVKAPAKDTVKKTSAPKKSDKPKTDDKEQA